MRAFARCSTLVWLVLFAGCEDGESGGASAGGSGGAGAGSAGGAEASGGSGATGEGGGGGCAPGYIDDGNQCADIDECESEVSCGEHALCVNEPGTFACVCEQGFDDNGGVCELGRSQTLAGGDRHACRIKPDGTLWCWGLNGTGQLGTGSDPVGLHPTPEQVGVANDWASVDGGSEFTCGLHLDGAASCWGTNNVAQIGDLAGEQWKGVSAGWAHGCAVRFDDTMWCWGLNQFGQTGWGVGDVFDTGHPIAQVGSDADWHTVAAGTTLSCGIKLDGTMWCWGGYESPGGDPNPTQLGAETDWTSVSGDSNMCGTRGDGTLWCWDNNGLAQVGSATDWASVSAGGEATCAVRTDGTLWCWGYNLYGQLGIGTTDDAPDPVQVGSDTDWVQAAVGAWTASFGGHACGERSDGSIDCWGNNGFGQLGNGIVADQRAPSQVGNDDDWSLVDVGYDHGCGLRGAGELWCWGDNQQGQLGDGANLDQLPRRIGSDVWTTVLAGSYRTVGLTTDGSLRMWGGNSFGTVPEVFADAGLGSLPARPTAVLGAAHWCLIKSDGALWCMGENDAGQVGIGTTADTWTLTQVGSATDWQDISVGVQRGELIPGPDPFAFARLAHSCGVRSGSGWCWGDNAFGQLGVGSTLDSAIPVEVGAGDWLRIVTGQTHTCGITTDGAISCWGSNQFGQLGNGSTDASSIPVPVDDGGSYVDVVLGESHACGLRDDGTVWCWGSSSAGALGIGATLSSLVPAQVAGGGAYSAIGGRGPVCAVRLDGTLWCWGSALGWNMESFAGLSYTTVPKPALL